MAGTPNGTVTEPVASGATTAAAQPVAGQTAGTTPTAGQPAAPWYADWKDESLRGAAELNGWKSAEDIAKDAVSTRKLVGIPKEEIVRVPTDLSKMTPEETAAIYQRLGVPKEPSDYGFDKLVPPGGDPSFAQDIAPILHEAHITKQQAELLAPAWDRWVQGKNEAAAKARQEQGEMADKQLRQEWGNAYDEKLEMARRLFREKASGKFGQTQDELNAAFNQWGEIVGPDKVVRFMADLAEGMPGLRGHEFIDGNQTGTRGSMSGAMTPEAAKMEYDMHMKDKDFAKKAMVVGTPEERRINYLIAMQNPGMELPKNVT